MEHSDTKPLDSSTQPLESHQPTWQQPVFEPQQAAPQPEWQPGRAAGPQGYGQALPDRPARPKSYKAWIALSVLVVLAILMAAVQAAYKLRNKGADLPPAGALLPTAAGASGPSPNDLSNTFRAVAKAVKPAVVYINITETVQQQRIFPSFPGFDVPGDGGGPTKQQASGSGFIVKDDGYIITNNHVVGKADKIDVTLADGRKFRARRIGSDPESDLAVIKIDASSLPTAVLGNSEGIEQGDWVLAIGSPFGLQQTITAGIISATGRYLGPSRDGGVSQLDRYIQTDASINPGNSGGPLVNMSGEVVGINTLIYSPNYGPASTGGGNVGIGFAIPSNQARQIYGQLIKSGKVSRGYLGVLVADLDQAKASALGVDLHGGALVGDIADANGPAAKAGLKSGDVITSIDGKAVHSASELTEAVVDLPVGHSARVDFIRDGQHESASVVLAERPASSTARAQVPEENNEEGDTVQASKLGLTVETITSDMASQLKLKIQTGALVTSTDKNGAAAQAGMGQGDVIHRIGSTQVKSASDLARATKSLKSGDDVAIQFERRGTLNFVTVNID
jgi:serine protease Do